jgi:hypothetical protein
MHGQPDNPADDVEVTDKDRTCPTPDAYISK